jgi:tetratricopeptide (TPR) repeat protein
MAPNDTPDALGGDPSERARGILAYAGGLAEGLKEQDRELAKAEICAAHASMGLSEEALQLALDVRPGNPRWRALTLAGKALGRTEPVHQSLKRAVDLEEEEDRACILDGVARSLAEQGEATDAVSVASAIENEYRRLQSLAAVAEALALSRRIPEAVETAKTLGDPDKASRVLSSAIVTLAKDNRVDEAMDLLVHIQEAGWRPEALGEVCAALVRDHKIPKALELFGQVNSEDYRTVVLAPLVGALVEDGKASMALALIANIESRYARGILIAKVVGELVERREIKQALEVTKRLEEDTPPDALIEIARGFAELGDVERAVRLAHELEVKGSRIAALVEVAHVLMTSKRFSKALAVTQQMKRLKARSVEQQRIVEAMAENGQVQEAITLSESIESPLHRVYALAHVAVALTGKRFEEYV